MSERSRITDYVGKHILRTAVDLSSFHRLEKIFFIWTFFDLNGDIKPILPPSNRKLQIYLHANSVVYDERDWPRLFEFLSLLSDNSQFKLEEICLSDVHTLTTPLLRETLLGISYLPTLRLNNCRSLNDFRSALNPELRIDYLVVEGCWKLQMDELQSLFDQGIVSKIDVFESRFHVGERCRVICLSSRNLDIWVAGVITRVKSERPFVADVSLAQSPDLWRTGQTPGTVLEDVPRLRLQKVSTLQ